jgi:hypothetical protein
MAILAQAAPVPARPPRRISAPRRITYATATPPGSVRPVSSAVSSALSDCPAVPRERTARFVHFGKNSSKIKCKRISAFLQRKALTRLLDSRKAADNGKKLSGYSAIGCGVWAMHGTGPEAPHNSDKKRAFMGARFKCNTRHCPSCAAAKAADYRDYMKSDIFPSADAQSLTGDLVTLTLAHNMQGDWRATVRALNAAFSHMHNRIRRQLKTLGVVGYIKSVESPVGRNGIHPHIHPLFFRPVHWTVHQQNRFAQLLRSQWEKSLVACGGTCNEHGFDYKPNCLNDYIAKFSTAHEVAAHETKSAKSKGRTFVQLLDDYLRGDQQSGEYFLRWSHAMSGIKRFDTRALAKALGVRSFEEFLEDKKNKTESMQSEFDALPDNEKLTINIPQDVVNVLSNSPVREYYPFVLDYGKRLCRDLTPENKPAKLKQWQSLFDRCLEEHRKYMAMRPHLMMDDSQIENTIALAYSRPLVPSEIAAYHTACVLYYRKPAQVNKLRRVFKYFEAVSSR